MQLWPVGVLGWPIRGLSLPAKGSQKVGPAVLAGCLFSGSQMPCHSLPMKVEQMEHLGEFVFGKLTPKCRNGRVPVLMGISKGALRLSGCCEEPGFIGCKQFRRDPAFLMLNLRGEDRL